MLLLVAAVIMKKHHETARIPLAPVCSFSEKGERGEGNPQLCAALL